MIYLFDTNVVVRMLYGENVSRVFRSYYHKDFQLLWHEDVLAEYVEVTERLSESISAERAKNFFIMLLEYGLEIKKLGEKIPLKDHDDEIFLQVTNSPEILGYSPILVTDNISDFSPWHQYGRLWTYDEFMKKQIQLQSR